MAVSGLLCSLSFGAPLGAIIGASFGWERVFELLAGLSLSLLIANRRVWPTSATAMSAAAEASPPGGIGLAPRLVPTVVWATALYAMYVYLGAWLTRLGFSTKEIAQVIACYGIGAIVGTLAGGRVADRIGVKAATNASLIGMAGAFALLPLAVWSGPLLELGFGLTSAVAQVFFPAQQASLVNDFPARRATVLAWNNSSLFLGIALGSLIGGETIAAGSFASALLICGVIALAGWLIDRKIAQRPATR